MVQIFAYWMHYAQHLEGEGVNNKGKRRTYG